MTTTSPGSADPSAGPASALLEPVLAEAPFSLHQLFRTAEKFCFSWPVHTVPARDRADSTQES